MSARHDVLAGLRTVASPSVLAHDLAPGQVPAWLVERPTVLERINGALVKRGTAKWRLLAAIAIDESATPLAHRSVLRVLLGFAPGSAWPHGIIARRAGVSVRTVSRVLDDLDAWGWAFVERRGAGRPPRITLTVPAEEPPDRTHHRRRSSTESDTATDHHCSSASHGRTP